MCNVFSYVAPFLRRAEEAANKTNNKFQYITITYDIYKDMKTLRRLMLQCRNNAVSFDYILRPRNQPNVEIYTDASTSHGVGGYIAKGDNSRNFKIMWNQLRNYNPHNKPDIVWMEQCGVVMALQLFAKEYTGKCIRIWCDNYAVCKMTTKKCACFKRKDLNELLRILCEHAITHRYYIWIDHIKGINNKIADALSRNINTKQYETHQTLSNTGTECKQIAEKLLMTHTITTNIMNSRTNCYCARDNVNDLCKVLNNNYKYKSY